MGERRSPWIVAAAALGVMGAVAVALTSSTPPKAVSRVATGLDAAIVKSALPEGSFELGFWTGREGAAIERLRITSQGDVRVMRGRLDVNGDATFTPGKGVVLRATDGPNCFRIEVDNQGHLTAKSVACP